MKSIFHLILIFAITSLSFPSILAQKSSITITGKVVEAMSNAPVEFATLMLKNERDNSPITGTTTDLEGQFELSTKATDFYVEISFIGFETKTLSKFELVNNTIELGTISLAENSQNLDEVLVRGEKSTTTFKLDKRVFNVGKDLSSTGMSALEVLNNVPSVNVNIEGEISLRGSQGVQILINGKPSVLASEGGNALGTITADMIDRIEVITNPSAKYDAEGTSGILNIVIKKEEKKGLNGSVTVNTGVPNNHSVGLSLNRRTEHFNLFSQLGFGYRTFPSDNETENKNLEDNSIISSTGDSEKNENFYNLIVGTDYHIDAYNIISLTGHLAYEIETEFSDTDFKEFVDPNNPIRSWNRDESTDATNPKFEYDLQYKREFEGKEDQMLLFSAQGDFFGKDQSSDFTNTPTSGGTEVEQQQTRTDFLQAQYLFKLDYTHPFLNDFTLETGAQYIIYDAQNDFAVLDFDEDTFIANPSLTNVFDFNQKVLGVYGTGAYEGPKWGIKVGLRLEHTNLNTLLINTNERGEQDYTNLFPSAHTSYKLNDNFSVQAGYSRRIYRPSLWNLNPFQNQRNQFNIRTGNPNLQPEFTDSYEITGIYLFEKTSVNLGIYHRNTTDVIERVPTFEDNITTSKPFNIGTNRATGIELNAKYSPIKWFSINGDFNFNFFTREGTFEEISFDFEADQWTSRITTKWKLPAGFDVEVAANYESEVQMVRQTTAENLFADLGIRKKVFKGKIVLNLSIRDVFASRVFQNTALQPDFEAFSRRQRGRFTTFGISYGFGKGEAMEFSGQKRF